MLLYVEYFNEMKLCLVLKFIVVEKMWNNSTTVTGLYWIFNKSHFFCKYKNGIIKDQKQIVLHLTTMCICYRVIFWWNLKYFKFYAITNTRKGILFNSKKKDHFFFFFIISITDDKLLNLKYCTWLGSLSCCYTFIVLLNSTNDQIL